MESCNVKDQNYAWSIGHFLWQQLLIFCKWLFNLSLHQIYPKNFILYTISRDKNKKYQQIRIYNWYIRIYHECEGGIEKSVPRITDWHHEACRVMTNGDGEERIFLSHPHTNNGLFFSLTIKYLFLYWKKHEKDFQKILNTLKCDTVTSFYYYNDVTDRRAASVWTTCG